MRDHVKEFNDFYQSEEYKRQLREFYQSINPKPDLETIEKLKEKYRQIQKEQHIDFRDDGEG